MRNTLGGIVMFAIGFSLIIFRSKIPGLLIRKQVEERETKRAQKAKRGLNQIKDMGLYGVFRKGTEIQATIFGTIIIIASISIFFPTTEKCINIILACSMQSIFAAAAACVIELFLLPILWKKVKRYNLDRSVGFFNNAPKDSCSDDPVIKSLEKKR